MHRINLASRSVPFSLVLLLAFALAGCAGSADLYDSEFCPAYDADADGLLYEDEFTAGLYSDWDTDDDDFLDADEFGAGVDAYDAFDGWDGYYDTWDADDDDLLGYDEFETGFSDVGYYDTWDADASGYLDGDECADLYL